MTDSFRDYEGMFLLEAGNPDFQAASEPVRAILGRSEAQILVIKPWDERKLAYDIRGRKRGLYVLTYFRVAPARVTEIEHDCELDERILRALILRKEALTETEMNAPTPATGGARPGEGRGGRRGRSGPGAPETARRDHPPEPPAEPGAKDAPADPSDKDSQDADNGDRP